MSKLQEQNQPIVSGPILRQMIFFIIPIFLQSVFQQIYNISDAVIVGRFLGTVSLGAINSMSNLTKLFINLFEGIAVGASIMVGQAIGAREAEVARRTVHTGVAFSLAGGAFLIAVCVPLTPVFMRIMQIPDDMWAYSATYTRIYFIGMVGSFGYNLGAGILRAAGDSRRPFFFLAVTCVVNIALDLLFVGALRWGVAGAAAATAASQFLSAFLVFRALTRDAGYCRLTPREVRFDGPTLGRMVRLGLPIGVSGIMYSVSNITIQSTINSLGTHTITAWGIQSKADSIVWTMLDSVNVTASTFVAQNFGAGSDRRVRESIRKVFLLGAVTVAVMSAALYIFARPIAFLFLEDASVVETAAWLIRIFAPFYLAYLFSDVFSAAIRGCGETVRPMILSIIGVCIFRVLWVVGITWGGGPATAYNLAIGYPISWAFNSALFTLYFFFGKWRKRLRGGEKLPAA